MNQNEREVFLLIMTLDLLIDITGNKWLTTFGDL